MANWRQLAMAALLADGAIDEREVQLLRKEFFADRRIDRAEMEFLLEARKRAASAVPSQAKNALASQSVRMYAISAVVRWLLMGVK